MGQKTYPCKVIRGGYTTTNWLWHGNVTADWGGPGTVNRSHDHTGDPRFAADGYHLLEDSTANHAWALLTSARMSAFYRCTCRWC